MHYSVNILPHLARFQLSQTSFEHLEAMQCSLIEELDCHRKTNSETVQHYESEEYMALESKLLILLEALDYISKQKQI